MKISTKTGDKGNTNLPSGDRVSKGTNIVKFLGELDELQSFLGWCRFVVGVEDGKEACKIVDRVQEDLFRMMSIAGADMKTLETVDEISDKDVKFLEKEIEKYEKFVGDRKEFVKPGKTEAGSRFHIARAVCRRAERYAVRYFESLKNGKNQQSGKIVQSDFLLKYLNRLSDLLFLLACKFEG
ncbi:cob(I)yrinic acid a,c-diamide adenosyltransferase [Candidatus Peregrinibacteria bacterium]|nr:cob(I)yrinic acid a,c-diamide adenosyltransferase [Candidatus Peregrinibacteria bacterium]